MMGCVVHGTQDIVENSWDVGALLHEPVEQMRTLLSSESDG